MKREDGHRLVRVASNLPAGDPLRRAVLSGLQKHSDPAPWINAVWDKVKKHGYKKFSRWDDHLGLTYQGTNIDRARNYDDVVSSEGFQLKKQLKRQLGSLVKTYQLDISSFYEGGGTWTLNIGARRPEGDKVDWKKETRQLMKLDGYKFDGEESYGLDFAIRGTNLDSWDEYDRMDAIEEKRPRYVAQATKTLGSRFLRDHKLRVEATYGEKGWWIITVGPK